MNSIPREYNSLVASSFVTILLCGAAGYFVYDSLNFKDQALGELQTVGSSIKNFHSKPVPPTEGYLKELVDQKKTLSEKIEELRGKIQEVDIQTPEISPEDFPKSLNQKVRAFAEKATKEGVLLPPEFHLGFDEYQTRGKTPPKQLAPYMARQLEAVSLLLDTLLETQPLELRAFQRKTPDELPDYWIKAATPAPSPPPSGTAKKAEEKDPKKQSASKAPQRASLWAETYQIEFSNRPERLRTFLNKLAAEKRAFLLVRSLKIVNSQETPPLKNPEVNKPGDVVGGLPADPASVASRAPGTTPSQAADAPTTGDSGSPYILGEEHVLVQMTVDLVSVVPPVPEPEQKQP